MVFTKKNNFVFLMPGKSGLLVQKIKTFSTYAWFFSTKRTYCSIIRRGERRKEVRNRG